MLHVPSIALARPLESTLDKLCDTADADLSLPIHLKWGGAFGGSLHALQLIASWQRAGHQQKTLRLPASFASLGTQERFASTLPGMAALYFTNQIKFGNAGVSRYEALRLVKPRVDAMQNGDFRNTLRGQGIALCCFGGADNEFLRPLYKQPRLGGTRELSDFRLLLPRLIGQLGGPSEGALNPGQLDFLSALLHQLLMNADEHGSYGLQGEVLQPSMRGLVLRLHRLSSIHGMVAEAGEDTAFRTYITKLLPTRKQSDPDAGAIGDPVLLELSVFDTGIGMGLRWLSERTGARSYSDFSFEDEFEAVSTCFHKHATTKASEMYGMGLYVAVAALKKLGAFMSLRTGRLSLVQDFSARGTGDFKPTNRFGPHARLSQISGTGFTICFKVR